MNRMHRDPLSSHITGLCRNLGYHVDKLIVIVFQTGVLVNDEYKMCIVGCNLTLNGIL